jgi:adenylate cyclase
VAEDARALTRRVELWFGAGMLGANIVGAVVVYLLVRFVLPLPVLDDEDAARRTNVLAFAAYLALSVPLGAAWTLRLWSPVRRWLCEAGETAESDQRRALLVPVRQLGVHAALWAAGAALFVALNLRFSDRLALIVGITACLGGVTTCTIGYVVGERVLRPVARRALAASVPERLPVPGVATRVLLTWALCSGAPILGVALVGAGQLTGVLSGSADRLAATAVVLGGVAYVVGLAAIALTARAIADPIAGVRRALGEVQRGRTDIEIAVYDGSEIGLLQAGFNRMVAGIRERERLRDLFGRQVGEEVASHALERGPALGGEVRDVAVLFVDVVGSTRLASTRPPAEVVDVLNEFFCVVVEVVRDHGGVVNKFEGDAALCVFGAPLDRDDPAGDALSAARALCPRLRDAVPALDVGIGVSAGAAVAGNVGAAERFEYTVIGDPVNEAARLTELAKDEPGRVLASEAAVAAARPGEAAHWTLGDEQVLRGRATPTRLATPAAGAAEPIP